MRVKLWGTRGSLASPGLATARYGGNTACVEVRGSGGSLLVLDAGTGIRGLGESIGGEMQRVDLLLTHLHMDHIQGLGFFGPLYTDGREVHIWGPASTTMHLRERLARYLSPPLFPVRLRDLPCALHLHDVPLHSFRIGEFRVRASPVCHPDPTVGYRISDNGATVTYLPDHEPALGARRWPDESHWISGFGLARRADLLIHDAQYTEDEYSTHVGWGHSSLAQVIGFAAAAAVKRLVTFHHDPSHDDAMLDGLVDELRASGETGFEVEGGMEGAVWEVNGSA